jgi:formylglycine-generating enzyme required for sulfatase activity
VLATGGVRASGGVTGEGGSIPTGGAGMTGAAGTLTEANGGASSTGGGTSSASAGSTSNGSGGRTGTGSGGRTGSATLPPGMALVPAGPFVMGVDDDSGNEGSGPKHIVTLSKAYAIDLTEVTNTAYAECVAAGACTEPAPFTNRRISQYYGNPSFANYPVLNVPWQQAVQYCAWAGKRLPTEAEWEKAGRGGCEIVAPAACGSEDERLNPWGNTNPNCTQANYDGCSPLGGPLPVGSLPAGDSPYGVHDLIGNAWEFTADYYAVDAYVACADGCTDPTGPATGNRHTIRGHSFANDPQTSVSVRLPGGQDLNVGFRCVVTVP